LSDSVIGAYRIIPLQRGIIVRQDSTIRVQAITIAKQDTIITGQQVTIGSLAGVRDSLTTVLRNAPGAPKSERFLGLFPMPSRTTSAILGVAVGTLLAARIVR
jgi:hypothetical protein